MENKQDELLTQAALDSAETLTVSRETVDESELDASEFELSLDEITASLKIPVNVFSFANPNDPQKPFKFAMRQLTAEEHGEIYGSVFDGEVLKDAVKGNVGTDGQVDEEAALDAMIENLSNRDDLRDRSYKQNVAAVFKCMVLPKKKSIKAIQALPRSIISTLAEGCREEIDRSWTFQ